MHLVCASKHGGCHKAQLVAGGHLAPDPIESIYSGVVSTRSLRLSIYLAKLNNMEVWGPDIGNAYLEATTTDKLYIVAGPEFEELQGHILVIHKALYCRIFGAYRLEFSSSIRQLVGLGDCSVN